MANKLLTLYRATDLIAWDLLDNHFPLSQAMYFAPPTFAASAKRSTKPLEKKLAYLVCHQRHMPPASASLPHNVVLLLRTIRLPQAPAAAQWMPRTPTVRALQQGKVPMIPTCRRRRALL